MLAELYVENFALIEALRIEFGPNLNIISGETGAGKSLLADAVELLTGGRGERNSIRTGANKALVEAVFHGPFSDGMHALLESEELEEDLLVLSREIQISGKNICRLNRRQIPLSFLKEVAAQLLLVHNQFAHFEFLRDQHQLELVDRFGRGSTAAAKIPVQNAYAAWTRAKEEWGELKRAAESKEQEQDLLAFQLKELAEANLKPGEQGELEAELMILENSDAIYSALRDAFRALYGAESGTGREMVYRAISLVDGVLAYDKRLQPLKERLEDIYNNLEDIAETLRGYSDGLEVDPRRLEEAGDRLAKIRGLEKKYRKSGDRLLAYFEEIQGLAAKLDNMDLLLREKEREKDAFAAELKEKAAILTARREEAAAALAEAIRKELLDLLLPDAKFLAQITPIAAGENGADRLDFLVSMNRGEEPKPLKKVASGGEMSRILLGMQVILAGLEQVGTIVFDEIDSGLGGKAAAKVGEKLATLAKNTQIIAVTHSPLVAAVADRHFAIEKQQREETTVVSVRQLHGVAIKEEIARMITGDSESTVTLHQAEALLEAKNRRIGAEHG